MTGPGDREDDSAVAAATGNPFADAEVTWHMATTTGSENYAIDLEVCGEVHLGVRLEDEERAASIKRGGDGLAAVLAGGHLALDTHRARKLRPARDAVSLYLRAWAGPDVTGGLFFSDFMALVIHPSGLAIGFLGVSTPAGKVFRELPLGLVARGGWLDLIVRVGDGRLDFFCNGRPIAAVPLRQSQCAPFDDELLIGAWKCGKPDLYGADTPQATADCRIDTVALWHRPVSDDEIAFLSGVEQLESPGPPDDLARAYLDFNAFFDASVDKDIDACAALSKSLRAAGDQDPTRPMYHLTQPLGWIYDPCGAFYHGGRYHVYSYRSLFRLLEYSSLDHYVSDDLVHWTQWPTGPWADGEHDVFCIYLMNHFPDDQGTPRALYTGQGTAGKFGILARSDDGLVSYTDKKAVLTKYHHDGHVWKEGDTWYTITSRMCKGMRPGNLGDAVMLWSSSDLEHWQERGEIFTQPKLEHGATDTDRAGFMEFPYLLPFGDKDVLMLGGHPVRYWVGRFDRVTLKFIPDQPHGTLLDHANNFHCFNPLCVDDRGPGGTPRRIIMALYAGLGGVTDPLSWAAVHAMPRSLEFESGRLSQHPLPEMQTLRGERLSQQDITVRSGGSGYISTRGDAVELIAEFAPGAATRRFGVKACMSDDGAEFVRVYFDAATREFGVDTNVRAAPGTPDAMPQGCGRSFVAPDQPVRLHVFLDKGLLEAFVDGQTCTTAAPERLRLCTGLDLFCEGGEAHCTRLDVWMMRRARA